VYFPQLEVVGDVGNAIWRISEAIKSKPASWDLRCDACAHRRIVARTQLAMCWPVVCAHALAKC